MMQRQQRHRSRSTRSTKPARQRSELDAYLRRSDERMSRIFARNERHTQRDERLIAGISGRFDATVDRWLERLDQRFAAVNQTMDDMEMGFRADVNAVRDEVVEIRKESKLLRWNIWLAAGTTVLGLAGVMSAMNSVIISAFESGRSSTAVSAVRHAEPRGEPANVSLPPPLHRGDDSADTLEDNRSQS